MMKVVVLLSLLASGAACAAEEPSCEADSRDTSDVKLMQLAAELEVAVLGQQNRSAQSADPAPCAPDQPGFKYYYYDDCAGIPASVCEKAPGAKDVCQTTCHAQAGCKLAPCTVSDGSQLSDVYPCSCGTDACANQFSAGLCDSALSACSPAPCPSDVAPPSKTCATVLQATLELQTRTHTGYDQSYGCAYYDDYCHDTCAMTRGCIQGGTFSPIGLPTSSPTPTPTPSPTPRPIPVAPSGVGDPHLRNVLGQRFDLMQPGSHMLMNIPKGSNRKMTLFRAEARAERTGGHCADMYFKELNATGQWVEKIALGMGGLRFSADSDAGSANDDYMARWLTLGPVDLKVVRGHLPDGSPYLNVYFKNIKNAGYRVGGLLGEDDHEKEATPSRFCEHLTNLRAIDSPADDKNPSSVAQVLPE